jgi:hypothetical protein
LFVLSTSGKESSIRAETHAPDIQVTIPINRFVLQMGHFVAGFYIKNLGTPIAASGNIFPILTKPYTTYNAIVFEGMY